MIIRARRIRISSGRAGRPRASWPFWSSPVFPEPGWRGPGIGRDGNLEQAFSREERDLLGLAHAPDRRQRIGGRGGLLAQDAAGDQARAKGRFKRRFDSRFKRGLKRCLNRRRLLRGYWLRR